jgi:hypothetical protein
MGRGSGGGSAHDLEQLLGEYASDFLVPGWCEVQAVVPKPVTFFGAEGVKRHMGVEVEDESGSYQCPLFICGFSSRILLDWMGIYLISSHVLLV